MHFSRSTRAGGQSESWPAHALPWPAPARPATTPRPAPPQLEPPPNCQGAQTVAISRPMAAATGTLKWSAPLSARQPHHGHLPRSRALRAQQPHPCTRCRRPRRPVRTCGGARTPQRLLQRPGGARWWSCRRLAGGASVAPTTASAARTRRVRPCAAWTLGRGSAETAAAAEGGAQGGCKARARARGESHRAAPHTAVRLHLDQYRPLKLTRAGDATADGCPSKALRWRRINSGQPPWRCTSLKTFSHAAQEPIFSHPRHLQLKDFLGQRSRT